jgi:uncharacterized protein
MDMFVEYLASIEDLRNRARAAEILDWVADRFPALSPKIAWNQPMFTDHGTFIIGFSVSRKHLAVAPEIAGIHRFAADILQAGYDHTKGLMRIPWESPVDYPLLERMIAFNIQDKGDCSTFWRK